MISLLGPVLPDSPDINDKIYDGKHEPLVTNELFDKVQHILRGKNSPKATKHDYLFKKMFKCGECGGTITWESQKGLIYGHCNHYRECTQETWVREDRMEEQMIQAFGLLEINNKKIADWIRRALEESHADEIDYHTNTMDDLNNRLKRIQKRLDGLYDDKLDEQISVDFYNQKLAQYKDEKNKIIDTIDKHSKASNGFIDFGVNFYELSQRAMQIYI